MDRQRQTDRLIDKQTESHAHTTLLIWQVHTPKIFNIPDLKI